MQTSNHIKAAQFLAANRAKHIRNRIVSFLACVVVFCTTYALILPAITSEKQCPLEEHVHSTDCYTLSTSQQVLSLPCTYDTLGVHVHTEACRDPESNLICGYVDYLVHKHGAPCYDDDGILLCQLPEIEAHEHSDTCYQPLDLPAAHTHGDDCFRQQAGGLTCQIPEAQAHSHTDACYASDPNCDLEETAGHQHFEECYTQELILVCEIPEATEPITPPDPELICQKAVIRLHTHAEDCYESFLDEEGIEQTRLLCTEIIVEEHIHTEECFMFLEIPLDTDILTCAEPQAHSHTENCFDDFGQPVCTEPTDGHTHSTMCYGSWVLTCPLAEHTHSSECTPMLGLSAEERQAVEDVIALIAPLPSYVEIEEQIELFAIAQDDLGKESYLNDVYNKIDAAYQAYIALGPNLQEHITNTDRLMDLAFYWDDALPAPGEHVHDENCYAPGTEPICTDVLEGHEHIDDCFEKILICTIGQPPVYYCGSEDHTHFAQCTDPNAVSRCGLDHIHVQDCFDPIQHLVVQIDALPTTEEAESILLSYELAEDWDSYELYLGDLMQRACDIQYTYEDLLEEERELIPNYHKMMDLAWLWNATT